MGAIHRVIPAVSAGNSRGDVTTPMVSKDSKRLLLKEQKSLKIIEKVFNKYCPSEIGAFWSGGKDSTLMLALIRKHLGGMLPIKVVGIDEGHFPEVYTFVESLKEAWDMDFEWVKDSYFITQMIGSSKKHRGKLITQMKVDLIGKIVKRFNWKIVFTGIRWDEHEARSKEVYFSSRKDHLRVHPILHYKEVDVWDYLINKGVPHTTLYDLGFRSLGAEALTTLSGETERSGRSETKEGLMYALRHLGYF